MSSDGRWLATGSRDCTARIWDLDMEALAHIARLRSGRTLTAKERTQYHVKKLEADPVLEHVPSLAQWQRPRLLNQAPEWHERQATDAKPGSFTAPHQMGSEATR